MAFGRKRNHDDILEQGNSEGVYDVDSEEEEENTDYNGSAPQTQTQTQSRTKEGKPLLEEVVFVSTVNSKNTSKNSGGSKVWICNHCKLQFTSSYSRIHIHFFGPPPGKKAEIRRCGALIKDREKYEALRRRVSNAEQVGVSKALKHSVISKKQTLSSTKNPIEKSFGIMERSLVDLKVMRGLCANGIPFNVLRNPQFQEMVAAINKAPPGYKAPSSEKARTVLLDECARDVEKYLVPIKDTWYTQGVSIARLSGSGSYLGSFLALQDRNRRIRSGS